MPRKKILVASLILSGCVLSTVACSEQLTTVEMGGDVVKGYKSAEELKNSSEIIVEIQATDVESIVYSNVVFSKTTAKVKKVFKGNLSPNDHINIIETGGISGDKNYLFEGNEAFKKNEKAIVYLEKYEGPITKDAYVILGAYQGKFKINDTGEIEPPKKGFVKVQDKSELKLE